MNRRSNHQPPRVPAVKTVFEARSELVYFLDSDKTQEFRDIALRVLEATVPDADLRTKLTPEHPLGCKRLVFATDADDTTTAATSVATSAAVSMRVGEGNVDARSWAGIGAVEPRP